MAKPVIHAESSVRRWGGVPADYLPIHNHMDSSKSCIGDNRHRFLTHNSWYVGAGGPLELIFGEKITNSDGREVCVRDIGELHILEDFGGYIPTPQDYAMSMGLEAWMCAKAPPPSVLNRVLRNIFTEKEADRD